VYQSRIPASTTIDVKMLRAAVLAGAASRRAVGAATAVAPRPAAAAARLERASSRGSLRGLATSGGTEFDGQVCLN
jgi:hypothetical protein